MNQLYRLGLIAVLVMAAGLGGYALGRHDGYQVGSNEVQQRWDQARAQAAEVAATAAAENAAETKRRFEAQQEIDHAASLAHARDLAAAVAGARAAQRLRGDLAAIAARGRESPGDPEAARQCQGDKTALAEGLSRCADDYQRVDANWRATYTAGLTCERISDALTAAQPSTE